MAKDPYETLGVARDATPDAIRRAYRRLAKKHHPDVNPGDKAAEQRFKEISTAHDLLSDPEKRARFDRGEIDAQGQERAPRNFYRDYAEGPQGQRYRAQTGGGAEFADMSDLFADLFARGGSAGRGDNVRLKGEDRHFQLSISLLEAVRGGTRRITLPEGEALDVAIPPGADDGTVLRLRGKGSGGWNGGPPGDALIELAVAPHPHFRKLGRDIHLDLPVTAAEAVLGAKIAVPTPTDRVTLTIPPHSDSGRQFRLRGRGLPARGGEPAGDFFVALRVTVPEPDAALEEALRGWQSRHAALDPRAALESEAAA